MKLDGMIIQKDITCFLGTDVGKLPPVTCKDWTESIIIAVTPSFWQFNLDSLALIPR